MYSKHTQYIYKQFDISDIFRNILGIFLWLYINCLDINLPQKGVTTISLTVL